MAALDRELQLATSELSAKVHGEIVAVSWRLQLTQHALWRTQVNASGRALT
jgi:hypothetical protein